MNQHGPATIARLSLQDAVKVSIGAQRRRAANETRCDASISGRSRTMFQSRVVVSSDDGSTVKREVWFPMSSQFIS